MRDNILSLPVEKLYGRQCLSDIFAIERDLVPPNLGDIVSLDTVRQEKKGCEIYNYDNEEKI